MGNQINSKIVSAVSAADTFRWAQRKIRLHCPRHRVRSHREDATLANVCRPQSSERTRCLGQRSEEHTSELQSPCNIVCRLLLEKKNAKAAPLRAFPRSRPPSAPACTSDRHTTRTCLAWPPGPSPCAR